MASSSPFIVLMALLFLSLSQMEAHERSVLVELSTKMECDPDHGQLVGHCQKYKKCVKDPVNPGKGYLQELECGTDLYWDSTKSDVHGGLCVYFENLDLETQKKYQSDPQCLEE